MLKFFAVRRGGNREFNGLRDILTSCKSRAHSSYSTNATDVAVIHIKQRVLVATLRAEIRDFTRLMRKGGFHWAQRLNQRLGGETCSSRRRAECTVAVTHIKHWVLVAALHALELVVPRIGTIPDPFRTSSSTDVVQTFFPVEAFKIRYKLCACAGYNVTVVKQFYAMLSPQDKENIIT